MNLLAILCQVERFTCLPQACNFVVVEVDYIFLDLRFILSFTPESQDQINLESLILTSLQLYENLSSQIFVTMLNLLYSSYSSGSGQT